MVPTFIHMMCHNKRLFRKDSMCRVRQSRLGCDSVKQEEESALERQRMARA